MSDLCVNIGCGATPTSGWLNFDNSWTIRGVHNPTLGYLLRLSGQLRGKDDYLRAIRQHNIRWADASRRIPLQDGSARIVYSSHMVEHLSRDEMRRFFAEARRVLAPNGKIRIAVPDIDYHIGIYRDHRDADKLVAGLLMSSEREHSLPGLLKSLLVGERHHQWMYSGASMAKELAMAGFVSPQVLPAGETNMTAVGQLDLFERAPESVFVEASR